MNSIIEKNEIKQSFLNLIKQADSSLIIQMAYRGDRDITNTIIEQCIQHPKLRLSIMLPAIAGIQDALNKQEMTYLFQKLTHHTNIKIFLYTPSMLHAKVICVNNNIMMLGSANFNEHSTLSMGETDLYIDGEKSLIAQKTIEAFLQSYKKDISQCTKVVTEKDLSYNSKQARIEGLYD